MAAKIGVLLLGVSIALLAFLAYRSTKVTLMLALSVAFSFVAVGTFVEGLLFEIFAWDLLTVHLIESTFILVGLATLAVLLRPRGAVQARPADRRVQPHGEEGP